MFVNVCSALLDSKLGCVVIEMFTQAWKFTFLKFSAFLGRLYYLCMLGYKHTQHMCGMCVAFCYLMLISLLST